MWTQSPSIHQPGQVDFGFDVGPVAEGEQARDGRDRMQLDVLADLRAEGPGVVGDPGGAGEADGPGEILDLFGEPEPQVHPARAGVRSGPHVPEQEPGGGHGDQHSSRGAHEH